MSDFDFKSAMEYLKNRGTVRNQADLAEIIVKSTSLVSKEAKQWRFPYAWAEQLAASVGPAGLVEEMIRDVPPYKRTNIPSRAPNIGKKYLFFNTNDIDLTKYNSISPSPAQFTDSLAVKINHVEKKIPELNKYEVFLIDDMYGSLNPDVLPGDTLIGVRCEKFLQKGIYIVQELNELKPKFVYKNSDGQDDRLIVQDNDIKEEMAVAEFKQKVFGFIFNRVANINVNQLSIRMKHSDQDF